MIILKIRAEKQVFFLLLEKDTEVMEADKLKCYCNQCKDTKEGEREHAECLERCKSKLDMSVIWIAIDTLRRNILLPNV